MDSGGWPEDEGGNGVSEDGWLARGLGLACLWLFVVVVVGGLWGLEVLGDDCLSAAEVDRELTGDAMTAVRACASGVGVPSGTIVAAMVAAGLAGSVVILAVSWAAVSSGHGRVRGRSARLREGW